MTNTDKKFPGDHYCTKCHHVYVNKIPYVCESCGHGNFKHIINDHQSETAYIFDCKECGDVWDVLDAGSSYLCRQCGNSVTQKIINGVPQIHKLTEEESDELILRNENISGW